MKTLEQLKEERKKKQKESTTSGSSGTENSSGYDSLDILKAKRQISKLYDSYSKGAESLSNDVNSRYYDSKGNYIEQYRPDYDEWKSSTLKRTSYLQNQSTDMKDLLNKYGKYYGEDFVTKLSTALGENDNYFKNVANSAIGEYDLFSQGEDKYYAYKNEGKYGDYSYGQLRDEISNLETRKLKALNQDEIDGYDRDIEWINTYAYSKDYDSVGEYDAALSDVETQLSALQSEAKKLQQQKDGVIRSHGTYNPYPNQNIDDVIAENSEKISKLVAAKQVLTNNRRLKEKDEVINEYTELSNESDFNDVAIQAYAMDNPELDDLLVYYSEQDPTKTKPVVNNKVSFFQEHQYDGYDWSTWDGKDATGILNGGLGEIPNGIETISYGISHNWDRLENEEIQTYNYILAKNGSEAADKYLKDMQNILDKRAFDDQSKDNKAMYEESGALGKIMLNIASVPANVFGSIPAAIDDAVSLAVDGELHPYSQAHSTQQFGSEVRQFTSEDIIGGIENEALGTLASNTYQAIMSGADSLLGATTMGKGYTVTMGMGAASQKARELYESGASNSQIALGSIASGVIEYYTEKVSFDKWAEGLKAENGLDIFKKILAQGFVESTEEFRSTILNLVSDSLIQGYNSVSEQEVRKLMIEGGLSEEEARKQVGVGNALEAFWSAYGGFVSGSSMMAGTYGVGIGAVAIDEAKQKAKLTKQAGIDITDNNRVNDLIATVKNTGNEKLMKLAEEVSGVNVDDLSNREKNAYAKKIGKLYAKTKDAQSESLHNTPKDTITSIVSEKLKANGVPEADIPNAAKVITDYVTNTNKRLSVKEDKIMKSVDGLSIVNDILNNKDDIQVEVNKAYQQRVMQTLETATLVNEKSQNKTIDTSDYSISDDGKTYIKGTDEEVTITGVSSISKGKMMVNLSNGKTENIKNIDLGSQDDAIIYQGILDMGVDASVGQLIAKSYTGSGLDANTYILGVKDAINYGKIGGKAFLSEGVFTSELSEKMREDFYNIGDKYTKESVKKKTEAIKAQGGKSTLGKATSGNVTFKDVDRSKLNSRQKASVDAIEATIAGVMGINVVFFNSPVNSEGKHIGKNGSYNASTNTIELDISAGIHGTDVILFTASHELTHYIKEWSPDKFKEFADFLVEQYHKHGVDLEALIQKKMNDFGYDHDLAFEEVVADSCESFLRDSNLMKTLTALAKKDMTLFEKIKSYIDGLLERLNKEYAHLTPDSREGREVLQMKDVIEDLHDLWDEAALSAMENSQNAGGKKNTTDESGAKYSWRNDKNGNKYWQIDTNKDIFKGLTTTQQYEKAAFEYILGLRDGNVVVDAIDGKKMSFIRISASEFTGSDESQSLKENDTVMFAQKMRLIPSLEDLASNASVNWWSPDFKNHKLFKERGFENFRGRVGIDNVIFNFVIRAGKAKFGDIFYDINLEVDTTLPHTDGASGIQKSTSNNRISNSPKNVKEIFEKNSERDNLGNQLTTTQTEYFKDSKVRDENGNLKVMYHGTPNATFTKFKRGTYFTEHKWYADNYQSQGASSLSYKKTADNPDTYAVYLDIKKPFDTRNKQERDIFYNEYYRQWGTGTDLMESGLPDWLDGQDLQEFLEEQGYDYDGLILDEGGMGGYGEEVVDRGLSYVVFSPEQVKSVDNKNPTKDEDYRYSYREKLDELNSQLKEMQNQIYNATMELKKFDSKAEQDKLYAVMNKEGVSQEELDNALQEYSKWSKDSGYDDAYKKQSALKDEEKTLRREIQKIEDKLHEELKKQIASFSDEDIKKYVSKAVRKYHTTSRLENASYLLTTGSMLDFSDGQGYRVKDHREISEILDLPDYAEYSDGMIAFMNMGNIRLQTYGIDISAMPNAKQVSALRDIISKVMREYDEFSVDFSKTDGYSAGSVTYGKGTSTSKIVADIKSYFETGVVPEEQSNIRDFLYSERVTDEETLEFLNKQIERGEYITVYRSFQVIDGGLYAPMNAVDRDDDGKNKRLGYRSEIGQWEKATESKAIAQRYMDSNPEAPYAKFNLDGGDNKTGGVAYNPYLHASNLVLNDQFAAAYRRNLVTVECRVPLSEAEGTYKAEYAKDGTGWANWKAGGVAGQLKKIKPELERRLFLSRYMLPVKILSDTEVASMYKEYLDGTDISVPWNVVTPSLRHELEKVGVNISYEDVKRSNGPLRFEEQFPNDIRYQERDPDAIETYKKVVEALESENAQLTSDVARLKELIKLQRTETHGKMFNKSSIDIVAKKLMKNSNAKGDRAELAKHLEEVYSYILQGEDVSWGGIVERAENAVDWLMNHEYIKTERDEYSDSILKDLRNRRFYLDDLQKKEVAYRYGSYNEFRKKTMGRFVLTDKAEMSLDSMWQSLSEDYPNVFDKEVTSNDQPLELMEIIDGLQQEMPVDYYGDEQMSRQELLMDVYEGYWDVSNVVTYADRKLKEFNLLKSKHNRQMKELRKTHKDKTMQLKKEHSEKLSNVKADMRKKALEKQKSIAEHYQESRKKNVESRYKTTMRKKIKGVVGDLNKMLKAGRKKANVKVDMRDAVEQALATAELLFSNNITNEDIVRNGVSATTSAESIKLNRYADLLAKREQYLNTIEAMQKASLNANTEGHFHMVDVIDKEIGTLNKELKDVFERERNRLNEVVISSAIQDLADAYKAIQDSEYSYISAAYNEYVYDRLLALKEDIGGSAIRDMSLHQLQEVYDAYKMVLHVVRTANTLFKEGKSVDATAGAVIDEIKSIAKPRKRYVPTEKLNSFVWAEMKPRTAFEKIGSDTMLELYDNLRKGEDTFAIDIYDAFKFAEGMREKYNHKKWDMKSRIDFKLDNGKTFSINLQQLMSIYAYSKREQALKHMTEGGFVFDSKETFAKGKKGIIEMIPTAETYSLSSNDLYKIINTFTDEYGDAKAYVDEMQKYLTDMGEKGNEVSRLVFGIDLFKEKVYFPLQSSRDYLRSNNDALDKNNMNPSLINSGMTKETVPNARNPIVLSSFDNVWAGHTNKMSLYHSFVPALEDFRKVYEYSSSVEGADDASVRAEIKNVFGANATDYISKLLDDVNGGMPTNEAGNPIMSLFGTFKKTSVGMSLSTVIQQPTAIIRAWSILNPKYFVGIKNNLSKAQWEEIKKYAPVAILKEIGGFDAGSGRGMIDYLAGDANKNWLKKTSAKIDDISMWGAGKADEVGWGIIWNAVKREIKDTTNLAEGSEEFLAKCGERFTEVITETQVYDSTFSRSGIMRSKGELHKFATSFMAEPTTSINMIYKSILNAKRGKVSKGKATATISSVLLSTLVASILASFVYAARDDDDDESYLEKYAEALGGRIRDDINPLNMLPYLRDIQSLIDGWDIERPDMAIFSDIKSAYDNLDSDSKTPYRKIEDFAGGIFNALGIPVKNTMREIRGIYNFFEDIFDDVTPNKENILEAFSDGFRDKETTKKDRAWNAYEKGDTSKVKETVNGLIKEKIESGKTEKEAKSAVRSSFTSTYKEKYLEAVENKDYTRMNEIRKFLYATGLYGSLSNLDNSLKDWRTNK